MDHKIELALAPTGHDCNVKLDDVDISDLCRGYEVKAHVGALTEVTLHAITPQNAVVLRGWLPEAQFVIVDERPDATIEDLERRVNEAERVNTRLHRALQRIRDTMQYDPATDRTVIGAVAWRAQNYMDLTLEEFVDRILRETTEDKSADSSSPHP